MLTHTHTYKWGFIHPIILYMCCLLLYCTQGLLYSLSNHLPAMNAWFLTLLSITELRTWWVFLLSKARELWMGGSRVGSESLCAKTPSSDGSLRVPEETHRKRFSHMRWKGNLHFPETEAKRNVWNTQVGRAGRRRQDMTYRGLWNVVNFPSWHLWRLLLHVWFFFFHPERFVFFRGFFVSHPLGVRNVINPPTRSLWSVPAVFSHGLPVCPEFILNVI